MSSFPTTPSGKTDRKSLGAVQPTSTSSRSNSDTAADPIEQEILTLWQEILPNSNIGLHDSFFDVGGHSLLAVKLFDNIKNNFSVALPLSTLFDAQTVAEQAKIIRDKRQRILSTAIVPIQTGNGARSLYLVPPAAGTGLNYRTLAKHIGSDLTIYTFNLAITPVDRVQSFEPLESMASRYVQELRAIQSEGPYRLGGICFGGILACEMANQIMLQGQKVDCIVLMDPSVPGKGPSWSLPLNKTQSTLKTVYLLIKMYVESGFSQTIRRTILGLIMQKLNLNSKDKTMASYLRLRRKHAVAQKHYRARRINTNALLICSEEFSNSEHYLERWKALINGTLTINIFNSASHSDLLVNDSALKQETGLKIREYLLDDDND